MCHLESGIIRKHRIDLAPKGSYSHSKLLDSLGIDDTYENAARVFVRAELTPPNNDITADIKDWKFVVDQDIAPDWFDEDRGRYEKEFREAVKEWVEKNFTIFAGVSWTAIKEDEKGTYYLLDDSLFTSQFGNNNNYNISDVRRKLNNHELAKKLKEELGDRLVPITMDLKALDGEDEYGFVEGDILSLMNLDLYRECKKRITRLNNWWWLTTPCSTPNGCSSDNVCFVNGGDAVLYGWYDGCRSVRPFFILKSSIFVSCSNLQRSQYKR